MAARVLEGDRQAPGADHPEPRAPHGPIPAAVRAAVQRLCVPVDISSLVVFRVLFGAIMLWEVWRYYRYGWIARYYIEPTFHFTYFGFDWVKPWPGAWMYFHFWVLAVLAVCIMAGAFYRVAATLFFLGISYKFLLDQATYLNHMYLVCVVSFVMIFVPCHRALSVDAWNWPRIRSKVAPTWALWILRFQIAVPYVYGGIAKLNADWLQGEPVRMWLAARAGRPVIGPLLATEGAVYVVAYGGLLFDLTIVPLLLWRRTRRLALLAALVFHLSNAYLFNIGIFPWFMIAATVLFFPPSMPRQLVARVRGLIPRRTRRVAEDPEPALPAPTGQVVARRSPGRIEAVVLGVLALHVVAQVLIPFRHVLYPGDVAWTDEGHRFSWRMKLRSKSHTIVFLAYVPSTGLAWQVRPRDYLTGWQAGDIDGRPDMILQLAHHMADDLRQQGYADVEIHVRALTSLNGRQRRDLIDSTVDLAAKERTIWPADWLLPLDEPLRRPEARANQ